MLWRGPGTHWGLCKVGRRSKGILGRAGNLEGGWRELEVGASTEHPAKLVMPFLGGITYSYVELPSTPASARAPGSQAQSSEVTVNNVSECQQSRTRITGPTPSPPHVCQHNTSGIYKHHHYCWPVSSELPQQGGTVIIPIFQIDK